MMMPKSLQQFADEGIELTELQHVGSIGEATVGVGMDLEEPSRGLRSALAALAIIGTYLRSPTVLPLPALGRCTLWVQSMMTVGTMPSMSGILRKSTTRLL